MSLWLFWSAVGLLVYTYVLFPALVVVRRLLKPQPYKSADITPRVSIIIAAHNEASGIEARLDNILALDYPRHLLEVVVASDGSTDGTDVVVSRYADRGIRLLSLPRQGKIPALNTAVAASSCEILVFSDANSIYAPDALRALMRPFADPEVGGVAGNQRYLTGRQGGITSDGERSYWNFDRKLKQFQSQAGNAISATGAIYAVRRSLFRPIPEGVTDDFVASTNVIAQGYRLVFAPNAVAYEPPAESGRGEFRRKVRVITQGCRSVLVMRGLLNPFRHGFYAVQIFSHKVLRRLMVFPLFVLLATSPLLWPHGLFYQVVTLLQIAFYGGGLLGLLLVNARLGRLKIFALPFFFCMVNAAALLALWNVVRGQRIDRWETLRQAADARSDRGVGSVSSERETV